MKPRVLLAAALLAAMAVVPARAAVVPLSAEISIGKEAAQYIESQLPLSDDPLLNARVQRIGRRVAGMCDRPDLPFEFHVVDTPDINAFCLPGGYVYVFRGLLQGVPNDDALAFILGHEIAHAVERHAINQFEKAQVVRILLSPLGSVIGVFARDMTNLIVQKKFSRDHESEADRCGLRYVVRAGFSADSGVKAMETLLQLGGKRRHPEFLVGHPDTKRRKEAMVALAKEIEGKAPAAQVAAAPAVLPEPLWLAPPPAGARPTPYFPLAVGHSWTYRLSAASGGSTRATVRVIEALPGSAAGAFRLETAYAAGLTTDAWVSANEEAILTRAKENEDEGWRAEWRLRADVGFEASGPEEVAVPAGTFRCLCVRRAGSDGALVAEAWFAEGVGLVKCVWLEQGVTQELMEYRLARPLKAAAAAKAAE